MPLRITMTPREASWCRHYSVIFRKRQKGRRLRRLGPRCLYSSAGQPLPSSPGFALCQLPVNLLVSVLWLQPQTVWASDSILIRVEGK